MQAMLAAFVIATSGISYIAVSPALAEERYANPKVVYQINYNGGEEDKGYRAALNNIQNHINAEG